MNLPTCPECEESCSVPDIRCYDCDCLVEWSPWIEARALKQEIESLRIELADTSQQLIASMDREWDLIP